MKVEISFAYWTIVGINYHLKVELSALDCV